MQADETGGLIRRDSGLDVREIMRMLPHRFPFLMIDRVIEIDGYQRAVAIKNVSINEPPQKKEVRPPTPSAPSASRPDINKTTAAPLEDHEDEKGAVIVGGVTLGLMTIWLLH